MWYNIAIKLQKEGDVIFISDDAKARLRAVDISAVVRRSGVELKRNKACCPFHGEKTPSFSVHPKKNIWHCFGCGAGGDAISYVMRFYGLSFPAAAAKLNEEFGLGIDTGGRVSREDMLLHELRVMARELFDYIFRRAEMALIARFRELHRITLRYRPRRGLEFFLPVYGEALSRIDRAELCCDIMAQGSFSEKMALVKEKEVMSIADEYYGYPGYRLPYELPEGV